MISFPKIKKAELLSCFDGIVVLYTSSKPDLIHAAERATAGAPNAIIYSSTITVDNQIGVLRTKVGVVSDKEGQSLFIKWVEELYNGLITTPVAGVSVGSFLDLVQLKQKDESVIKYNTNKMWEWIWELTIDEDSDSIKLDIRGAYLPITEIVPYYVTSNIQQAVSAFNNGRNGAALSLLSISLESALRDALKTRGYTYQPSIPSRDSYTKLKMHVNKDANGFLVTFPDPMPLAHTNYLNNPSDPNHKEFKIKRVELNGDWVLQISGSNDILDFWSSDQVNVPGQKKIGGLGTALDVARNDEGIIDQAIFPLDFDRPIQAVRNNLIHLSGEAMEATVYTMPTKTLTLKDFINSKARVFDTICSIGGIVNDLYYKISAGTL